MLMLSREKDESFVIDLGGEVIKIMVARIAISPATGKREVQLGVEAPLKYKVWRTELYESMQENKKAAAAPGRDQALLLRELLLEQTSAKSADADV